MNLRHALSLVPILIFAFSSCDLGTQTSSFDPEPSPGSQGTGLTLPRYSIRTEDAFQPNFWMDSGSGAPLFFAYVVVGNSPTLRVQINNLGEIPFTIHVEIGSYGGNPTDGYSVSDNSLRTVNPGETYTFKVTYSPTKVGSMGYWGGPVWDTALANIYLRYEGPTGEEGSNLNIILVGVGTAEFCDPFQE